MGDERKMLRRLDTPENTIVCNFDYCALRGNYEKCYSPEFRQCSYHIQHRRLSELSMKQSGGQRNERD